MPITPFIVTLDESGQKLLQFLSRRLSTPKNILHRWIRTGQVRINGHRSTPFIIVQKGDKIRIPPYAQNDIPIKNSPTQKLPLPTIIEENTNLIIFNKPAGLPIHGGTHQTDSLMHRIKLHYANKDFTPTPVHRIDKETSGILLVSKNYTTLKELSLLFSNRLVHKTYLAWVVGKFPYLEPITFTDSLTKIQKSTTSYVVPVQSIKDHTLKLKPKEATLTAYCIKSTAKHSLLMIKLHTGRTHQIRVQLSSRKFPIVGDKKYGCTSDHNILKLHAFSIHYGTSTYNALPPWNPPWDITLKDIPCNTIF